MNDTIMIKEQLSTSKIRFEDIQDTANHIESLRDNFYVKRSDMIMENNATVSFKTNDPFVGEQTHNRPIDYWALAQLSTKLGIPSGYAEKCIENGMSSLAATNVNTWLHKDGYKNSDYRLRLYDGKIDAFLSASYTPFDSDIILDTIAKSINVNDYHIVGSHISNARLHLRMISDTMLDIDGEDLYPGIFIDSSDVGRTALSVRFGIWKQVCTNGLCISKLGGVLYRQRHMGITTEEVMSAIKNNIKTVPDLIKASESVIKAAANSKIPDDKNEQEHMMARIKTIAKLSDKDVQKVWDLAMTRYSLTRWGIVNSMTEIAQRFELDQRIAIENAAGRILVAA